MSYPARAEGLGKYDKSAHTKKSRETYRMHLVCCNLKNGYYQVKKKESIDILGSQSNWSLFSKKKSDFRSVQVSVASDE